MSASPKSRPQIAQRWPRNAEGQRRAIRDAADDAREIVDLALDANRDNNPGLVRAHLAMIKALMADIQRLTVEARVGPEGPGIEE